MHNKFAEQPNKYHYVMPDRFKKNIYKGMSDAFWKGYHAGPEKEVICFIEEGLSHRATNISLQERAYIKKEDIDNYINNDRVFKLCPMHPSKQAEPFKLKFTGGAPRIKPQAYENVKKLESKMANRLQ